MPGTIQVSVLDLLDLPPSSISVKVSMGKKEHQVWDKGVFSFPLTNLRENLILTLYDIEGNELSRTGVNTKLVVEKGFWDDLFPLEGGGHLHMKLQFVLSEEERKRIREMRESALKKKREELLISSERRQETAAVARVGHNTVAAFNHEVTDSRESIIQREAVSNSPENREDIRLEHMSENKTDGKERTPAEAESSQEHKVPSLTAKPSQEHKVLHLSEATQQIAKKTDTQSPPDGVPAMPISSEGAFGYSKPPSNSETDETEGTSSTPIPPQERKPPPLAEVTQQTLVKIDTQSLRNDITTRSNSSQNQTHSNIKHIALEKTPKNGVTDREGTSSEATQQIPGKINIQSPPNDVTTSPYSLQNQTHSTIKQIALETPRNNETDREGASSEAPRQIPVKIDAQSPDDDITKKPKSSNNQTDSTIKQLSLMKIPRNNETDREGTLPVTKVSQELEVFHHTKTTQHVMEKTGIQSRPYVVPTRFISSKGAIGSSTVLVDEKSTSTSSPLEENQTHSTENQTALEKAPSNGPLPRASATKLKPHLSNAKTEVSLKEPSINEAKMENTETKKQIVERELNPHSVRKPLEVNLLQNVPHLNKVKTEISLKGTSINEAKMENTERKKQVMERELNPFSVSKPLEVNVQQNMKYVRSHKQVHFDARPVGASGKHAISQSSEQLDSRPAAVEGNNTSGQVECDIQHKKENVNRQETLLEEFAATSEAKTATVSGRILDDPVRKEHTRTVQQTVGAADRLPISQSSRQLELLDGRPAAVEGYISSSEQVNCNIQHKKEDTDGQETLLEEFVVTPEASTAIVSGRSLYDPVSKEHAHTVHHKQQQQGSALTVIEECGWRTSGDESEKINTCGTSGDESAIVSGRILDDPVSKEHTHTVHHEQQGSALGVLEECGWRTSGDESDKINTFGTSLEERKSLECLGDEQSHSEVMGNWILPDERRRLCITTGTKQMLDFVGCLNTCDESNQRETSLSRKGVEKEAVTDNDSLVKTNETVTISHNLRKSKLERSKDDRDSGGLVGQAIKIAIMVAFGTLVVVTRKIRNR